MTLHRNAKTCPRSHLLEGPSGDRVATVTSAQLRGGIDIGLDKGTARVLVIVPAPGETPPGPEAGRPAPDPLGLPSTAACVDTAGSASSCTAPGTRASCARRRSSTASGGFGSRARTSGA